MEVSAAAQAVALAQDLDTSATVLSLPEGASMMVGEDGEQYVTISQDGQTYAIPLSEYQSMPGGTITIQAQQINALDLINTPPQILVQATASEASAASAAVSPPSTKIAVNDIVTSNGPTSAVRWANASMKPWSNSGNLEPKRYKPIKVDNWGIFLLNRLQAYFQKKEYTDLTLRFPSKNAQIKVHKLVLNACTDYFIKQEESGLISSDGIFDMPDSFLPELVAPIIRFMYTGRLDFKSHMFIRLRDTAASLGMAVLTKLLDAQINAPSGAQDSSLNMRRKKVDDPVKQIKRIKKIERKFVREQKQKPKESPNERFVPGKKLPIWKKRENPVIFPNATSTPNVQPVQSKEMKPVEIQRIDIKDEFVSTPKAYGKVSNPPVKDNFMFRELQENANFEKVRQISMQKSVSSATEESLEDSQVMSPTESYNEGDEDDYYDNDAGLDYDESVEQDEDQQDHSAEKFQATTPNSKIQIPSKPILKSSEKESPAPRKSVRFSLRPASAAVAATPTTPAAQQPPSAANKALLGEIITPDNPEDHAHEDDDISAEPAEIKSPPKKRKANNEDAMDKALDEFSKVAEQEEKELNSTKARTTRRGRVVTPPNLESPSETPQKTKPVAIARKSTPKPRKVSNAPQQDHSQLIADIMRKNPEMFKGNKPVKIKVMTKNAEGKNVVKVITVKAQEAKPNLTQIDMNKAKINDKIEAVTKEPQKSSPKEVVQEASQNISLGSVTPNSDGSFSASLRATPKVKYTGKRGRPPIIKPGEKDPHAKERRLIAKNLQNSSFMATKIAEDYRVISSGWEDVS